MSENLVGQQGVTGNAFINSLPEGTVFEHRGGGLIEVVDLGVELPAEVSAALIDRKSVV